MPPAGDTLHGAVTRSTVVLQLSCGVPAPLCLSDFRSCGCWSDGPWLQLYRGVIAYIGAGCESMATLVQAVNVRFSKDALCMANHP